MKRDWLIIPDIFRIEESLALAQEYNAAFEYNDFFDPDVYSDEEEIKKRISLYKQLSRDRSKDTLHGVFLDIAIASRDPFIADYSRSKVEQSMAIARELNARGVVFHSGLIRGLDQDNYINQWLFTQEAWIRHLLDKYPDITIFMENTFEKNPEHLIRLKHHLSDCNHFQLCLDYGHACLSGTAPEQWVEAMAKEIGHIHLNDNDLTADLHRVPGTGAIDFKHYKQLIEVYKIDAPTVIEIAGVDEQRKALEYMNAL